MDSNRAGNMFFEPCPRLHLVIAKRKTWLADGTDYVSVEEAETLLREWLQVLFEVQGLCVN